MLGRFLEFSAQTPDIVESLRFYKLLGFHELEIGDIWSHKYAVVSDGEICIGLHDRSFNTPALTFVHQDLARTARAMTDHGFDFDFMRIDEDEFNELGFVDCDGNSIAMLEARTFSPPDYNADNSVCGRWFEVSLPTRDAVRAGRFWAPLAPEILRIREEPTTHMRFNAGEIPLGLSESIALKHASHCFRCEDKEAAKAVINQYGFAYEQYPGFEGAFMVVKAPEGTMLYLFDEDFLGELYEVEESGEYEQL